MATGDKKMFKTVPLYWTKRLSFFFIKAHLMLLHCRMHTNTQNLRPFESSPLTLRVSKKRASQLESFWFPCMLRVGRYPSACGQSAVRCHFTIVQWPTAVTIPSILPASVRFGRLYLVDYEYAIALRVMWPDMPLSGPIMSKSLAAGNRIHMRGDKAFKKMWPVHLVACLIRMSHRRTMTTANDMHCWLTYI